MKTAKPTANLPKKKSNGRKKNARLRKFANRKQNRGLNQDPNTTPGQPSSTNMSPKRNRRGKPLKRLNPESKFNIHLHTQEQPQSANKNRRQKKRHEKYRMSRKAAAQLLKTTQVTPQEKSYEENLQDYVELRKSDQQPIEAIPSQELLWVRDESGNQEAPSTSAASSLSKFAYDPKVLVKFDDDDIEEGEIVEREVDDLVDLIQESFAAVTTSKRNFVDLCSPEKEELFYEDRKGHNFGEVPKYKLEGSADDDVILLDSSQEDCNDDSVIFVKEEKLSTPKVPALAKPECLTSPVVNNLMSLVPEMSAGKKNLIPKRKQRLAEWKARKQQEMQAKKIKQATPTGSNQLKEPTPTVSSQLKGPTPTGANQVEQREKRIILIDGSNVAMGYTDDYGSRKTDKDFSAEGLQICIKHFESQGFQVKAVVPEYRVRREKSSNHALMNELKVMGKLVLTPSKSYDDRVILKFALDHDAAVVSNDHYRDLTEEKPEYNEVVKNRLIRFNWLFKKLVIIDDPHGKAGPQLNDILYKKPANS